MDKGIHMEIETEMKNDEPHHSVDRVRALSERQMLRPTVPANDTEMGDLLRLSLAVTKHPRSASNDVGDRSGRRKK